MDSQANSNNKATSDDQHEFEQNLQRLQESVNRRKKWRMNDFIRKKILRQTIENKLIFYRETQQYQKKDSKAAKNGNFVLDNSIKSTVNIKRDLPLRSITYNDFDSPAVRSMPEFSDSVQKMQLNPKVTSKSKIENLISPTNAIAAISPDLSEDITNDLIVAGVNIKEAKRRKTKEKIKALRKYFNTKPKSESDGLPIIKEQTELQLPSKVSPSLYIDKKPQQKILPKIGLVSPSSKNSIGDSFYKGYYTSSFQLFSNQGGTTLPVINLNKLTIVSPPSRSIDQTGAFDHKATNYSKFINNLKNKSLNYDKTIDIDTGDDNDCGVGNGGGGGCSVIDIIAAEKNEASSESIANSINKINKLNINFSMRNIIKNSSS